MKVEKQKLFFNMREVVEYVLGKGKGEKWRNLSGQRSTRRWGDKRVRGRANQNK